MPASPTSPNSPAAKRAKPSPAQAVVHWLRADLRVRDSRALHAAYVAAEAHRLPLLALFVLSPAELAAHDTGALRADFVLRTLAAVRHDLAALGIPLAVVTAADAKDCVARVVDFALEVGARELFYNTEYEVDESRRDAKVTAALEAAGVRVRAHHDQCVAPPGTVLTQGGKTSVVFTPFKNAWYRYLYAEPDNLKLSPPPGKVSVAPTESQATVLAQHAAIPDAVPGFPLTPEQRKNALTRWPAGEAAATAKLTEFATSPRIKAYKTARDFPNVDGTSSLSPYLAVGAISARTCVEAALAANNRRMDSGSDGAVCWISEICWRDFYRHILVAHPRVCMYKPFKPETDKIPWVYDESAFKAWCDGKTGFPIVDAGMRQLNELGWMHNRLRMVVAMFLTKDLMIDWRKGEKYFMNKLIDGDFSSNNGGWQWAASTGTDSQPYFRVFNPLLQSEKFDESGEFIRKWVPELRSLRGKAVHDPWGIIPKTEFFKLGYPKPIVDHKEARDRVIAAFKKALQKAV